MNFMNAKSQMLERTTLQNNSLDAQELRQKVLGSPRWGQAVQFALKNLDSVEGQTILDLGCGNGIISVFLALHGAKIIGIDIDAAALREAHERAAHFDREGACTFLVGAGEAMSVGTETVDIVFSRSTLQYMNRSQALKECLRVLKPGGKMILLQNLPSNPFLMFFRLIRRWRSREGAARAYVESIKGYVTLPELQSLQTSFSAFEYEFYHLLDVPAIELAAQYKKNRLLGAIKGIANRMDMLVFKRVPFVRQFAWYVGVVYKGKRKSV
jgi:ubiquinone/menaquinone biosynthesis C-methylase UbiE